VSSGEPSGEKKDTKSLIPAGLDNLQIALKALQVKDLEEYGKNIWLSALSDRTLEQVIAEVTGTEFSEEYPWGS